MSEYGVFSGPYFSVFGRNTEIYGVILCIQSEYSKIWARKNFAFGKFSRSERYVVYKSNRLVLKLIIYLQLFTSLNKRMFILYGLLDKYQFVMLCLI